MSCRCLRWLAVLLLAASIRSTVVLAQSTSQPARFARIAILRPHNGHTVDFEAGYIRHLAWHQQMRDPFVWYGWTITFGDRQRWFVYATFGHLAADFDNAVAPADDERDNLINVLPHAEFLGNALYEYLPPLSRGTGAPQPAQRLEFTSVELNPSSAKDFEAALSAGQAKLPEETLWFRMIAGGSPPRYMRLRPLASLSVALDGRPDPLAAVEHLVRRATIEILTLRPQMSLGLTFPGRE